MKLLTVVFVTVGFSLGTSGTLYAQQPTQKDRFLISTSKKELQPEPGASDSIDINVIRAKGVKGDLQVKLSGGSRQGISLRLEQLPDSPDHYRLCVTTSASADPTFNLLVACTIGGKTKGLIVPIRTSPSTKSKVK